MAPRSVNAQLKQALAERDEALAQLADARALLDLQRLPPRSAADVAPPAYPRGTEPGNPPLRYVLVDRANDAARAVLGPVHTLLKQLAGSE